jgi:uncharacterized membrane protein YbhN (UPF0104 family)
MTARPRRRWTRVLRVLLGAAVGAGAVVSVVGAAGGLAAAAGALEQLRPGWLAVAVAAAAGRIGCYGVQLRLLERGSSGVAVGLALTIYGLGAVTPAAPAEGLVLAEHELRRRGRSREHALLTLGFSEWFTQRTFYVVAIASLTGALVVGAVTLDEVWPLLLVAVTVAVALVVTARLALTPGRPAGVARAVARVLRTASHRAVDAAAVTRWQVEAVAFVGGRRRRAALAVVSAAAVVADGAVLAAACQAAGLEVPFAAAVLGAVTASMVTWVPLLPAGLGLVEAALPAVLARFGAPLDEALAASLAYRAAGTMLPALAGGAALVALRAGRVRPA